MRSEQLQQLFTHLEEVIVWRIDNPSEDFNTAPKLSAGDLEGFSPGRFISDKELTDQEVVIFLMALLPRLDASLLRRIHLQKPNTELFDLCATNENGRLFYPTIEAAQYILGGDNILKRLRALQYFNDSNVLLRENVVVFSDKNNEPTALSTNLNISQEAFDRIILDSEMLPKMSDRFPAEQIFTRRSWNDLILPESILTELQSIEAWYTSSQVLMKDWDMQKTLKPGYRVLFFGEPGTGKTLAASLLGKYTNRPVFRVDVSMVVSKYIGETEKKLARLFDMAENKDWILFFDEADAIFGKRTNVRDAHDKYANQEVSYLLQRIETFSGLIILASNYKNNMDKAFTRRFHMCLRFPSPKQTERLRMWQENLPKQLLIDDINLEEIAGRYELTGANIMNIIQDVSLKTIAMNASEYRVNRQLLLECIKKEYVKEDRVFS
ncbi:MAG: ATP-binding protein [Flavobacterium sp.]|nr:ATP-binding protein [Flavobacterium sp.]